MNVFVSAVVCVNPVTHVVVNTAVAGVFLTQDAAEQWNLDNPPQTWSATSDDGQPLVCTRVVVQTEMPVFLAVVVV